MPATTVAHQGSIYRNKWFEQDTQMHTWLLGSSVAYDRDDMMQTSIFEWEISVLEVSSLLEFHVATALLKMGKIINLYFPLSNEFSRALLEIKVNMYVKISEMEGIHMKNIFL